MYENEQRMWNAFERVIDKCLGNQNEEPTKEDYKLARCVMNAIDKLAEEAENDQ